MQKCCFDKTCYLTEVIVFNFMGLVKMLQVSFPFGSSNAKQSKEVQYISPSSDFLRIKSHSKTSWMKQTTVEWKHKVNCNKLLYKCIQEIPEKGWSLQDFHFKVSINCFLFFPLFCIRSKQKYLLSSLVKTVTCKNPQYFCERHLSF